LEFPSGVTWQNGQLYVVDLGAFDGSGQILTFDSNGNFVSTFAASGTGANKGDLFAQFPSSAAFDSQGNLLSANLGPIGPTTGNFTNYDGSIYEYSSTGTFIQHSTQSGGLVDSSQFPQTGPTTDFNGIIPSELIYLPSFGTTVNGTLNPGSTTTPGILTAGDV